ncbi:DoxX family protein [Aestuariivirga litoralis]|uniref:DoxX family protein n=1 Tax=Aestuariivirga litoralis TaxID=2650924 RepID=UPI0018C59F41|nr:DoxX family protein [Aestuariivirga litoralis]MBG1233518.1 DoxX family protein [Aestuariivirga litoralis]
MTHADFIPYATLLLRVSLGVLFLAHGLLKLLVFKPAGTAAYFKSLGLPGFVAYMTIAAELGGGMLLLLGVATTLVALALIPLIIGTIVTVHGAKGWMFSNEGGGWEFPAFWALALLIQSLLGSGATSLGASVGLGWLS